jgi:hypothetical protein
VTSKHSGLHSSLEAPAATTVCLSSSSVFLPHRSPLPLGHSVSPPPFLKAYHSPTRHGVYEQALAVLPSCSASDIQHHKYILFINYICFPLSICETRLDALTGRRSGAPGKAVPKQIHVGAHHHQSFVVLPNSHISTPIFPSPRNSYRHVLSHSLHGLACRRRVCSMSKGQNEMCLREWPSSLQELCQGNA